MSKGIEYESIISGKLYALQRIRVTIFTRYACGVGMVKIIMKSRTKTDSSSGEVGDYVARLEAVLNTVIDGIITIDDKAIIKSFNPSAVRIFGYQPEEVLGRNVNMLMPEPYHSEHDGYLRNYITTGTEKVIGKGREVSARRKDGTVFPMELGINKMVISNQVMFVGTIRDISDRKRAEEALLRSNEELERFAYLASHDLQEPVRMVRNFTKLLHDEYKDSIGGDGIEYMNFIIDASQRMQELINDLLEYSRVGYEAGEISEVHCNSMVNVALANLSEVIEEAKAEVIVEDLPIVTANSIRFMRLIQNLVGNGIKYRDRLRQPKIRISAKDNGSEWLFCIEDNGIGIKDEYLEQIFIIFKRLHSKHEYKGTGIGLTVCKKIVESFEGKIWATSVFGEGTKFFFTIQKRDESKKNYHVPKL